MCLSTTPYKRTGEEVTLHEFLTLILDGGEQSALHPGRFITGKERRYPPDRSMNTVVKRKPFSSAWNRTLVVQSAGSSV
jgi:hypothetical protein